MEHPFELAILKGYGYFKRNEHPEKGPLMHCWWECRLVWPLSWRIVWNFLGKLKMELPLGPVIPLLGIHPKNKKEYTHPTFTAALFTIAKIWEQSKSPSVDEWIKKMWYIYTMEYYADVKKKELLPFATTWMDLENIMLSEVSQSEKDKYHVISLIGGL